MSHFVVFLQVSPELDASRGLIVWGVFVDIQNVVLIWKREDHSFKLFLLPVDLLIRALGNVEEIEASVAEPNGNQALRLVHTAETRMRLGPDI